MDTGKVFWTSMAVWAMVFVLVVTVLSGCTTYDLGGSVTEYKVEARANKPRVISGLCASACTLYLNATNTCYTDDAKFVFHGLRRGDVYDKDGSKFFAAYFWPEMRAKLEKDDALRSVDYLYTMTGKQVRKIDTLERNCNT